MVPIAHALGKIQLIYWMILIYIYIYIYIYIAECMHTFVCTLPSGLTIYIYIQHVHRKIRCEKWQEPVFYRKICTFKQYLFFVNALKQMFINQFSTNIKKHRKREKENEKLCVMEREREREGREKLCCHEIYQYIYIYIYIYIYM